MRARRALLALLLALAPTCTSYLPRFPGTGSGKITEEEVRARVGEVSSRFTIGIASTADAISEASNDREVRRRALLWKVRMTPLVQSSALSPSGREALLELYALAVAQRQYLEAGAGSALFGDQQPLARKLAADVEDDIAGIAGKLLEPAQMMALRVQVEELALRNPIRGEFMVESTQSALDEVKTSDRFTWVLSAPLAPFRALEGVESGAVAMHELNATGRQFNDLLAGLPEQSRWQVELLLYDVESRDTVVRSLASLETLAQSSARFSATAERFPEAVREQAALLLRDSEAQATLRELLASVERSIAGVNQLASATAPQLDALERTAVHVERTAGTVGAIVRDLQHGGEPSAQPSPGQPEPPQPPNQASSRPFDVLDYEKTAARIGDAAVHVQGVLQELPDRSSAESWIDHLFWRVLALLASWFGLRLLYRIALARALGTRRP